MWSHKLKEMEKSSNYIVPEDGDNTPVTDVLEIPSSETNKKHTDICKFLLI